MVGDHTPTRELASEMTYVWSETVPTRGRLQALAAAATSGVLFLTVKEKPGAVLHFSEN